MSKRVFRVIRAIITMSAPTHWKQLHRRVIKVIRAIMAIRVVRVSGAVKSMGVRERDESVQSSEGFDTCVCGRHPCL